MIGHLRSTLAKRRPPHLILDVNGVDYEVEVPMAIFYQLPPVGEPVVLHTHLVVRKDAYLLYDFAEKRERELFRELTRLNGVGPKSALMLASGLEVDELVRYVQVQDTSALVKVPGVSKKTIERLLVGLKDRSRAQENIPTIAPLVMEPRGSATVSSAEVDAVSVLITFSFKLQGTSCAAAAVPGEDLSSEGMIHQALRGMAQVAPDDRTRSPHIRRFRSRTR